MCWIDLLLILKFIKMKKITQKFPLIVLALSLLISITGYASTTETEPKTTGDETSATINDEQATSEAKAYFKNLSAKDRKLKMKEAKQAVKEYKKDKKVPK